MIFDVKLPRCSAMTPSKGVLFFVNFIFFLFRSCHGGRTIIAAINAGGPAHVDSNGIQYSEDPLEGRTGIASDYGHRLIIGRVNSNDQLLYQTERYALDNFHYEFKITDDSDYVLVLKFSEVWFSAPNQKVFSIAVNGQEVVHNLDIFAKVGRGVAHDELVPFSVKDGRLRVNDDIIDMPKNILRVQFIKGYYDNPKINALYIMKGTLEEVPTLLPFESFKEEEEMMQEEERVPEPDIPVKTEFASGPKQLNPFDNQDPSSMFLPVFIGLACFIPVLFCLCKI